MGKKKAKFKIGEVVFDVSSGLEGEVVDLDDVTVEEDVIYYVRFGGHLKSMWVTESGLRYGASI